MARTDLNKRAQGADKVKAHEAVGRVRSLLRAEAKRYWEENPLLVEQAGGRPVEKEEDNG
jgi:hypothetical protein